MTTCRCSCHTSLAEKEKQYSEAKEKFKKAERELNGARRDTEKCECRRQ